MPMQLVAPRRRARIGRLTSCLLASGLLVAALAQSAGAGDVPDQQAEALADVMSPRLVPNAGFEEPGAAPARWSVTGSASVVTTPVHTGGQAVQTVDDSATAAVYVRSQTLAAMPGETLTVGVWAQRVSGLSGTLYVEYWRADGGRIDSAVRSKDIADVAGWQQVTVGSIAPEEAVTATVLLYSKLAAQGVTVWDDVSVRSEPPPSRRVPNAGFEELREAPAPTQWTVTGSAALVSSPVYSGRRSLRTADGSGSAGVAVLSRNVPVFPGETLLATVQAQVVSGHAGALYLEYRRADGSSQDSYKRYATVAAVSGWQTVAVQMVAPTDAVTATLRIYSSIAATGTTIWDDIRLRSSRDVPYAEAVGTGSVLFVGDQRVESLAGVTRIVHPGTKTGNPAIPGSHEGVVMAGGSWDANPRLSGTVLIGPDGRYRMWYTAAKHLVCDYCTGYAESGDGIVWDRSMQTGPDFVHAPGGVVENPRFNPGDPASPRYFTLYTANHKYYAASSRTGRSWTTMNAGRPVIDGWDVGNVTYDPARGRFVAMTKQWTQTAPFGPRTVSLSTSQDFVTWTRPQLALSADPRDHDMVVAKNPNKPKVLSEIYGMPAVRYGEQYLGLPWMFDITYNPDPLGNPGPDIGRQHIQLAASNDLLTWSRPARDDIITPGALPTWDWGYHLTGTTMLTLGDQVRLYYSAFAGEHSCDEEEVPQGICTKSQGPARVGLVTWPRDRFISLRAGASGGTVITRTLLPAGDQLRVNVDPRGGQLRVEVLDASGVPVPGYTLADATPIVANTLGEAVQWGSLTTLPGTAGPIRLRFHLTGGDLYSYAID